MDIGETASATCARISSLVAAEGAPLLAQCVDLDMRLYYAAVQNLIYECAPQTTLESRDTPPIHCAQHVQQYVVMSIQLPAGLQCDHIQMAELRQVQDGWNRLSQDDIRHIYDHLHGRIHTCIPARRGYTLY